MALNYAFEIADIFPRAVYEDAAAGPALAAIGFAYNMKGNKVPLFCEKATVEALNAADKAVKEVMLKSGWGLRQVPNEQEILEKSRFIIKTINELLADRRTGRYDDQAVRYGLIDLMHFMDQATKGLVDIGNEKTSPPEAGPARAIFGQRKPEPFDLAAALSAMTREFAAEKV